MKQELLEQYILLTEKKDHLIKKLDISDNEKDTLINFFKDHANLENKIDWNNKDLSFDDFKSVLTQSKTAKKKAVKSGGIEGLTKGEDYLDFPMGDDITVAYIPLTHEASKLIASNNIGKCIGNWCTAMNTDEHWREYTIDKGIVLIYIIHEDTKYAIAYFDNEIEDNLQIFNADDEEISELELENLIGIDLYQTIDNNFRILKKAKKTIQDSISIYDRFNIKNYTINDDGTIDVDGDVDLKGLDLMDIPINFRNVYGSFDCSGNFLINLDGCPKTVRGDFICSHNELKSLDGCPETVNGIFDCSHNMLTSLKGAPELIGGNYICSHNDLTSLDEAPQHINGDFNCYANKLTSLEGAPKEIGGSFGFGRNRIRTLEHFPKKVGGTVGYSPNGVNFTQEEIDQALGRKVYENIYEDLVK